MKIGRPAGERVPSCGRPSARTMGAGAAAARPEYLDDASVECPDGQERSDVWTDDLPAPLRRTGRDRPAGSRVVPAGEPRDEAGAKVLGERGLRGADRVDRPHERLAH